MATWNCLQYYMKPFNQTAVIEAENRRVNFQAVSFVLPEPGWLVDNEFHLQIKPFLTLCLCTHVCTCYFDIRKPYPRTYHIKSYKLQFSFLHFFCRTVSILLSLWMLHTYIATLRWVDLESMSALKNLPSTIVILNLYVTVIVFSFCYCFVIDRFIFLFFNIRNLFD